MHLGVLRRQQLIGSFLIFTLKKFYYLNVCTSTFLFQGSAVIDLSDTEMEVAGSDTSDYETSFSGKLYITLS